MLEVLIGVGAGVAVAVTGLLCYRRGLRDGASGCARPGSQDGAEEQSALMKKYEAILDYDPYGERV